MCKVFTLPAEVSTQGKLRNWMRTIQVDCSKPPTIIHSCSIHPSFGHYEYRELLSNSRPVHPRHSIDSISREPERRVECGEEHPAQIIGTGKKNRFPGESICREETTKVTNDCFKERRIVSLSPEGMSICGSTHIEDQPQPR